MIFSRKLSHKIISSHKNAGLHPQSKKYNFGKTTQEGGGSQIEYSHAFLELKNPFFGNEKGCDADREARGAVNSVWITVVL